MKIESDILTESEYDAWDAFVAASSCGSIYATTSYLRVLADVVGARFRVMAVRAKGRYLGGIALFETNSRWGTILSPRLLLQYNGFVLADHESKYPSHRTSSDLRAMDQIAGFIEQAGYARTLIKCRWPNEDARIFLARDWRAEPSYTYLVPLGDLEAQWGKVDKNLRRLIKRCESNGMLLTEDDDFDSFFRMHEGTHDRKGSPIYLERARFEKYFKSLKEAGVARLYSARLEDGTPVASQLVLAGRHPVCDTVSASADSQYLNTGANAFLRWKVFEHLAQDGYTHNDLTDAGLNSVTRFKSQFGGDLRMCLVLKYPSTWRYRLGTRLEGVARSGLNVLGLRRTG